MNRKQKPLFHLNQPVNFSPYNGGVDIGMYFVSKIYETSEFNILNLFQLYELKLGSKTVIANECEMSRL